METIDQLFIRACKSREPKQRVLSVYRRFYLHSDEPEVHLVGILTTIVDKYLSVPVRQMIDDLNPQNAWKFGGEKTDDFITTTLNVLINRIRLSERDKFPGLTPPLMFRKMLNQSNYVVHYNSPRPDVPCETVDEVWEAIGKRAIWDGYSVSSPKGLDVSEFVPY